MKKIDDYSHDSVHPTFNSANKTVCQHCRKVASVYQSSVTEKWVCFKCLPPEDIARYPGWKGKVK